jgi:hypothetical protein
VIIQFKIFEIKMNFFLKKCIFVDHNYTHNIYACTIGKKKVNFYSKKNLTELFLSSISATTSKNEEYKFYFETFFFFFTLISLIVIVVTLIIIFKKKKSKNNRQSINFIQLNEIEENKQL